MQNNFWRTDRQSDYCISILYSIYIQEKSENGSIELWTEFFSDANLARDFFYPQVHHEG